MSLDLDYRVNHGKLEAKNSIVIDHLKLGEPVNNPKATQLPIKLAIALMKDRHGKIELDFPITGALEDPKFSIASAATKIVTNLIEKVISSPFSAIANLIGSDSDLGVVLFEPGQSVLPQKSRDQLSSLIGGLKKSNDLLLEIKGIAYHDEDSQPLGKARLLNELKQTRAITQGLGVQSAAGLESMELSSEQYQQLLQRHFRRLFPSSPLAKQSISDHVAQQMEQTIFQKKPIDQSALRTLARDRSRAIFEYVTDQGKIAQSRLFLLEPTIEQKAGKAGIHASLTLSVQ